MIINYFMKRLVAREINKEFDLTQRLAKFHNCTVDYEMINDGLNSSINFKFNGAKSDLDALKQTLQVKSIARELLRKFPQQKVNFIEDSENNEKFNVCININKISNFYKLADAALFNLKIPFSIREEKCGFLKGKNILIELSGESQDFQKFKTLMNSFIDYKNIMPIQKK